MQSLEPALYLVPVPLGENTSGSVLPRHNFEVLLAIRHFIVESAKMARRAFAQMNAAFADKEGGLQIDIDALTFHELNEHTDLRQVAGYLEPLEKGESVGLLSDAGCPCLADPGNVIVEMAHRKSLRVVPLVGPSSLLLSLMASGFNGQSFCFHGYLPAKPHERKTRLREIEAAACKHDQTQIFIETPYRNLQLVQAIVQACRQQTRLCVALGLTTPDEFIKSQSVSDWQKFMRDKPDAIKKIPAIFLLYR